jgi:branched-chain amino acid transport system permease protein
MSGSRTARRFSPTPRRVVLGVVVVLLAVYVLMIPQTFPEFRVAQFSNVIATSIAVLGLGLLTGFNGQISVGHGAFFGVGAYTTAILTADHGWSHLSTIPVTMVLCFAIGVLVGLPALRISGLYLALVTLALATLFPLVIQKYSDVTGGSTGIRVPSFEAPAWAGDMAEDQWAFYVLLTFAVVIFVLVRNLIRSRVGRAIIAIRDGEIAAEVLGVPLARYKVITFGISAMVAGVAGSLIVMNTAVLDRVDPAQYTISRSIEFLAALVIGGAATIIGPVLGSLFIVFVPELSSDVNAELSRVIFGGVLIILMLVLPGGFLGGLRRLESAGLRRFGLDEQWRRIAPAARAAPAPDSTPDGGSPTVGTGA